MKPTFDPGDPNAVAQTRRMFGAFHRLEELTSGDARPAGRPSFARLHAYVGETGTDPEIEAALQDNPSLRADYRRLVEKHSAPIIPFAIAADTGETHAREGVGCRLHFVPSSAEPSQTYVIVEFTEQSSVSASTLFLCDRFDNCRKVPLEAARDGKVQLLLENSSDLLARLMDKDTEIRRGL